MGSSIRITAAVITAKILTFAMRLAGSGGTSLPGKVALKMAPNLLSQLSSPFTTIMITGTNGKTTTARMVARLLECADIPYITNKSGANLSSGITGTLISAVNLSGKPKVGTLLLEVDEAAFRITAPAIKPKFVIATNFFRDQLDRYGELYSTLNAVRAGLKGSPATTIIYNADDSLCASLGIDMDSGERLPGNLSYGLSTDASPGKAPDVSDAAFCIRCSTRYTYTAATYGHLGHFSCPNCGYQRPEPDTLCETVVSDSLSSSICIRTNRGTYNATVSLPGLYNVYNALSASALAEAMGLEHGAVTEALQTFERGFGRMETFVVAGKNVQMILVKNPTGFNQVLQYLSGLEEPFVPAFIINDKIADGTDVSWLWDVDFEGFVERLNSAKNARTSADEPANATVSSIRADDQEKIDISGIRFDKPGKMAVSGIRADKQGKIDISGIRSDKPSKMTVSGIRADDMALRLKYAGVSEEDVWVLPSVETLFDTLLEKAPENGRICIMPTYTAMLELRKILAKRYGLKSFWK